MHTQQFTRILSFPTAVVYFLFLLYHYIILLPFVLLSTSINIVSHLPCVLLNPFTGVVTVVGHSVSLLNTFYMFTLTIHIHDQHPHPLFDNIHDQQKLASTHLQQFTGITIQNFRGCVELPRWRLRLFGVLLELPICLAQGMVLGESGKGIATSQSI